MDECGCSSGLCRAGWRAYRVDDPGSDEPPALAFYCPHCAALEFDEGAVWSRCRPADDRVNAFFAREGGDRGSGGRADGSPVTGLTTPTSASTSSTIQRRSRESGGLFHVDPLPAPPDGIYSMGTNNPGGARAQWDSDELVTIVEVENGDDRGRAMLNVEF